MQAKPVKTYQKIGIGLLLACAVLGAGAAAHAVLARKDASAPQVTATSVSYTGKKGETVLAELREVAHITTQDSQYGVYVSGINGTRGGTGGNYWDYYVNGKQAAVGAGSYVMHGGEAIQWKFEK